MLNEDILSGDEDVNYSRSLSPDYNERGPRYNEWNIWESDLLVIVRNLAFIIVYHCDLLYSANHFDMLL